MSKYGIISDPNLGKDGPEITPYLITFHAVIDIVLSLLSKRALS